MTTVTMQEAKTHLSQLLDRAADGEEIVIAKSGKPVAKLVALARQERRPGRLKGRIRLSADFDALPEEIAAAFRGERP